MSDHRTHELKLADYAAGSLSDADAEDFEMHLLACSTCVTEVEKELQLHAMLHNDPAATRAMVARKRRDTSVNRFGRAAQALLAPASAAWSALGGAFAALRLKPAPAFAFAAGIVAGAALLAVFGQHWSLSDSQRPFAGATALRPDRLDTFVGTDEQSLTLEGTACRFTTRRADDLLVVEIDVQPERHFNTAGAVQIDVRSEAGALTTVGFEQRGPQPSPIHLGAGQIRIDHTGVNTYVLLLRDTTLAPLRISLRSGDVRREIPLQTRVSDTR